MSYEELAYLFSRLFPASTVEKLSDGQYLHTFNADPIPGPTHIDAVRHNKEVLAATVASALGVPALSETTKDELWDAVSSFFQDED